VAELEYNDLADDDDLTKEERTRLVELRRVLYGSEDDEIGQRLKEAVDQVENVMRPRLGR
jgi:hypothetical protein